MPIWTSHSVSAEPEIVLIRWRVLETKNGDRHFVGARADDLTGRVSSTIVQFDAQRRSGVTLSGRIYELSGEPGLNLDADYVWDMWRRANGITQYEDVTGLVIAVPKNPPNGGDGDRSC